MGGKIGMGDGLARETGGPAAEEGIEEEEGTEETEEAEGEGRADAALKVFTWMQSRCAGSITLTSRTPENSVASTLIKGSGAGPDVVDGVAGINATEREVEEVLAGTSRGLPENISSCARCE